VGLIHDLGKVLCLLNDPLPQWAVVGDTFPVGCKHDENIVFFKYFKENPDTSNPELNSRLGIYKEFCGLDNVHFSFGHDEYMYQVCVANKCKIPKHGLAMIRYHSCYAWHRFGGYRYLMNESDYEMLKWVVEFNKFDLYSKKDKIPDVKKLRPYYEQLVKKYFPVEKLKW
jgi:inositol oxygenase